MNKQLIGNFIKDVSTSINPHEIRRSMTSMRVLCKPDRLVFTGTNGIKLIEKTYPVKTGWAGEVLIPSGLLKVYADLKWAGRNAIKTNLAPMQDLHTLTGRYSEYPKYEPYFAFSHRKGNLRLTIDRKATIDSLKGVIPSLDREDNYRLALTQLGWGIDIDVNGSFLCQVLKGLHSENLLVRFDTKHYYITIIGENERALLTMIKRRPVEA